jgi:hypothetical protein
MLAEAEPKLRRRRNEAACGAPVARFGSWVGPLPVERCDQSKGRHLPRLSALVCVLQARDIFHGLTARL